MSDLFISYARIDQGFVGRLNDALVERSKDAWVDWEDIPASAKWLDELRGAIEAADAFVFVISPESAASMYCRQEAEHALAAGKRIIPVLWRDVDAAALPDAVATHNWISLREQDDFAAGLDSLVKALDTDLAWSKAHTRLLTRALEWERAGHENSFLLRGRDLDAAEGRLSTGTTAERNPVATPLMAEYVIASRRTSTRGLRLRVAALSAGLVIALALAVFSFVQLQEAVAQRARAETQTRLATGRELAQASANQLAIDPELSLLLAIRGVETAATLETDQALRAAIQASRVRRSFSIGTATASAAMSDDGRAAVVGMDGRLELWNTADGTMAKRLVEPGGDIHAAAISADGSEVLAATGGGVLRHWTIADAGSPMEIQTNIAEIAGLAIQHGGDLAVIVGVGGLTETWNLTEGSKVRGFDSATDAPISVASFSRDGSLVATGSADGRVRIFDVASGKLLRSLEGQRGGILAVAWSRDGALLASGADDGTARVWDPATGDVISTTPSTSTGGTGPAGAVTGLAFNADATRLLELNADGVAWLWLPETGAQVLVLRRHPGLIVGGSFLGTSGDVVSIGSDGSVRQWDTAEVDRRLILRGHADRVVAIATSPDGATIATGSLDGTTRIWDATRGTTLVRLKGLAGPVLGVAFAPDGRHLATASVDGTVRIWALPDGTATRTLQGPGGVVYGVAFSPAGDQILAAADGGIAIWRSNDGRLIGTLPGASFAVGVSPDGKTFLTGQRDGSMRMVDAATMAVRRTLAGHTDVVVSIRYDPAGSRFVTASADGTARIWDAATGTARVVLRSNGGAATTASWNPDGSRVVSSWFDGKVRVWDPSNGELLAAYPLERFAVRAAAFAADGRSLLASSRFDAWLISCDVCGSSTDVLNLGRARVTRALSADEEGQFLHVPVSAPSASTEPAALASPSPEGTPASAPPAASESASLPPPTNSATTTPPPSVTASGGPMKLCEAGQSQPCDLAPGMYRTDAFSVPFTFSVNGDWQNAYSSSALQFLAHQPDDAELSFFADVTRGTRLGKIVPIAPGPDGFLAYIRSIRELAVGPISHTTVGGLEAVRFDVTLAIGDGVLDLFFAGEAGGAILPGERHRYTVVDVHGKTVVVLEDVVDGAAFDALAPSLEQVLATVSFV